MVDDSKRIQHIQRNLGIAHPREATLGDDTGVVFEPGKPSHVRVTYITSSGEGWPQTVRRSLSAMAYRAGLPVLVYYDRDTDDYRVKPNDLGMETAGLNPFLNDIASDLTGGFLDLSKAAPLYSAPTTPPSGYITVKSLFYNLSGTIHLFGGDGAVDLLTSYTPATSGYHGLVALFLVPATDTIEVIAGTTKPAIDEFMLVDVQELMTGATRGGMFVGIWRLYNGQTEITDQDRYLLDPRQMFDTYSAYDEYVRVQHLGSATYDNAQQVHNWMHSTGYLSGGDVTDNGDGTIDVAAGTGFIRATDSDSDTLYFCDWPASTGITLTDQARNYIYVVYNSGSPAVSVTTSASTDYNTVIRISEAYRDGTTLSICPCKKTVVNNHPALLFRIMMELFPFSNVSGGRVTAAGTSQFAIAAGTWWAGMVRLSTTAFDGTTQTFPMYYRDGLGGWSVATGQTAVNLTQYDDNSGTLATMNNNYYSNRWVYLATNNDVKVIIGQAEYNKQSDAEIEEPPATVPDEFYVGTRLLARITIEKSTAAFISILNVLDAEFKGVSVGSGTTVHNDLTGLQGGTTSEYYHLTAAEYAALGSGGDRPVFRWIGV